MLLSFALVIVIGVFGMISFFSLAVAGIWGPGSTFDDVRAGRQSYVRALAEFYASRGESWTGIEERLMEPPFDSPEPAAVLVLVDRQGRVIVSEDPSLPVGKRVEQWKLIGGAPVTVKGDRVGTLLLEGPRWPLVSETTRTPRDIAWGVGRSFLFTGLGLILLLLGLAIIFSTWLTRPIRGITAAAKELAAGKLDVQVRGTAIREVDDLSQAFNSMAGALAQADQQRRQLTADVAHELRTPLTIMKGRLEGIQDGVYQPTPEEIARLLNETALLERLVEDLRLLALADAGQLPLYPEPADPRGLLESTATSFAGQAREQGVALRIEAARDLPAINVDPQRMAQVLANLVANALRHTPPGGSVTLSATTGQRPLPAHHRALSVDSMAAIVSRRSSVVFQVGDTGHGIAPEHLPHIFDRFWRTDRARTRGSGGAGLGLAITKQIVIAHGGTIEASSALGKGTTITISLPAQGNTA